MTMRALLIFAIVCYSGCALAQTDAPKAGKPTRQVKPQAATGCKLVGTVKGTKLWAGDCAPAAELRGTTSPSEPTAPVSTPEANPPDAKQ
jgi:hypothetical protein